MARIDNLTNFLTDVASAIKTKKGNDTDIPAANFDTEIANLPSGGSGDVKLFDTIEHMQQDSSAQLEDMAVVYRESVQSITEESEFSSCIFPNTVVLEEAFTDEIYGSFRSTGGNYFNGMVDMSSTAFMFDGYGGSSKIRVQYESQDGITYTRTDGGEELQEFGATIK